MKALLLKRLLRTLYYRLPPALRYVARWLYYLPADLFDPPPLMVPPRRLVYTGRGDFVKQGDDWLNFFVEHGLKPEHRFLDIGSGIGRIARPLTSYLTGPYEGFDVVKTGVDWCRKNIGSRYTNFHFTLVPLHNDLYKTSGRSAAHFRFPFHDGCFHFACAISVFTHLLPEETENYLQESARVLTAGGKLCATFFILTGHAGEHSGNFSFPHKKGFYALMDDKVKHANVAYTDSYLLPFAESLGLRLVRRIQGSWRGDTPQRPVAFQDVLVWEKTL